MPNDERGTTQTTEDHQLFAYQIRELQRDLRGLGDIMRDGFNRLEEKLDEHRADQAEKMGALQSRVDRLEVRVAVLWGAMVLVAGAVAGTIWKIVTAGSGL